MRLVCALTLFVAFAGVSAIQAQTRGRVGINVQVVRAPRPLTQTADRQPATVTTQAEPQVAEPQIASSATDAGTVIDAGAVIDPDSAIALTAAAERGAIDSPAGASSAPAPINPFRVVTINY